jgi:hypothetical protein
LAYNPCSWRFIEHCYSLAVSDEIKRNSALKAIAGAEIANGYSFTVVASTIRALRGSRPAVQRAIHDAVEADVSRGDVRNSGNQWSKTNPDAYSWVPQPLLRRGG